MNTSSAPAIRSGSVVNVSRPEATPWASSSGNPGSWKGASPRARRSTFSWSVSRPVTSWPILVMHAACTAPR